MFLFKEYSSFFRFGRLNRLKKLLRTLHTFYFFMRMNFLFLISQIVSLGLKRGAFHGPAFWTVRTYIPRQKVTFFSGSLCVKVGSKSLTCFSTVRTYTPQQKVTFLLGAFVCPLWGKNEKSVCAIFRFWCQRGCHFGRKRMFLLQKKKTVLPS